MPITISLDEELVARLDELVDAGLYADRASALREGIELLHAGGAELVQSLADLDAAIAEGVADDEAGHVRPAEEVFKELSARYRSTAGQPAE